MVLRKLWTFKCGACAARQGSKITTKPTQNFTLCPSVTQQPHSLGASLSWELWRALGSNIGASVITHLTLLVATAAKELRLTRHHTDTWLFTIDP